MSRKLNVILKFSPFDTKSDVVQEKIVISWGDGKRDIIKTLDDNGFVNKNLYDISRSNTLSPKIHVVTHSYASSGDYSMSIGGNFRDATDLSRKPKENDKGISSEPYYRISFPASNATQATNYQVSQVEVENSRWIPSFSNVSVGWEQLSDNSLPPTIVNPSKASSIVSLEKALSLFSGTTIPSGFFTTINPQSADSILSGAANLTSIPANLFDNMTDLRTMTKGFAGCSSLTSLPAEIFRYNTKLHDMTLFSASEGINTADYSRLLQELITYPRDYNSLRAGEAFQLNGGSSTYNAAGEVARNQLLSLGWKITDGGKDTIESAFSYNKFDTITSQAMDPNLDSQPFKVGDISKDGSIVALWVGEHDYSGVFGNYAEGNRGYIQTYSYDGTNYTTMGSKIPLGGNVADIKGKLWKGLGGSQYPNVVLSNDGTRLAFSSDNLYASVTISNEVVSNQVKDTYGVMKVYDWDGSDWNEVLTVDGAGESYTEHSVEVENWKNHAGMYDESTSVRSYSFNEYWYERSNPSNNPPTGIASFANSLAMSGDGRTIVINAHGLPSVDSSSLTGGIFRMVTKAPADRAIVFTNYPDEPQDVKKWGHQAVFAFTPSVDKKLRQNSQKKHYSLNEDGSLFFLNGILSSTSIFKRDKIATTQSDSDSFYVLDGQIPNSSRHTHGLFSAISSSVVTSDVDQPASIFAKNLDDRGNPSSSSNRRSSYGGINSPFDVKVEDVKVSDDGKTFIILSTLYLPSARFDSNGYYAKSRSFENSANASLDVEHIYADKYYNRGSLSFVQVYKRRDSFPMYQPPQVGLQPLEAAYRLVPEHEAIAKITGNDPNDNLNDFFYMGSYNTDGKLIFETELTGETTSKVISSYSQERYLAMLKNGLSTVIYRDSIFPDFDRTTDPKSTAKFWFDTAEIDLSSDGNTIIIAQNDDTSDRTKEIVVLENKNENNIYTKRSSTVVLQGGSGTRTDDPQDGEFGKMSNDGEIFLSSYDHKVDAYGFNNATAPTTPAPTTTTTTTVTPGTDVFSRLGSYLTSSDFASNGATSHSFGSSGFGNYIDISDDGSTVFIVSDGVNRTNAEPNKQSTIINVVEWNNSNTAWEAKGDTIEIPTVTGLLPFGFSPISCNSDGTSFIVGVGARNRARVYNWNGSAWTVGSTGQTISNHDGLDVLPELGTSTRQNVSDVDMNASGNLAIVGVSLGGSDTGDNANAGVVSVYKYTSGTWTQLGSDILGTTVLGVRDKLGERVSIHGTYTDDNTNDIRVLVSSPQHWRTTSDDDEIGKIDYYKYDTSTQDWVLQQTIYGSRHKYKFGMSMSLSEDGSKLAVGSRLKAFVYEYDSGTDTYVQRTDGELTSAYAATSTSPRFSWSIAVANSGATMVGAPMADSQVGSVEFYKCGNTTSLDMSEACSSGNQLNRRMIASETRFTAPKSVNIGPVDRGPTRDGRVNNKEFKLQEVDGDDFEIGETNYRMELTLGTRVLTRYFGQRYGWDVAISKNGNIAVVSVPLWRNMDTSSGETYINSFDSGAVDSLGNKGRVMIFSFNNSTPPIT